MLKIYSKLWGKNSKEEEIYIYTLENEILKIEVINIGACIKKIEVKEVNKNVVVSYENIREYEENPAYIGAIIGRNAGRIEKGLLKIDNEIFKLNQNNGENNLHGGLNSVSHRVWKIEEKEDRLSCYIKSEHLENGYPGNVDIRVDYILKENELTIEYFVKSDRKTYINLTNHSYFNLSGDNSPIYDDVLKINSDYMLKINKNSIPYEVLNIKNSIFDFSDGKKIKDFFEGKDEQKELANNGIDHPFILNKNDTIPIKMFSEKSKIEMEVETDNQAVVIYTANYFNDIGLKNHSGICFETQEAPNLFKSQELDIYPVFTDERNPYKKYTKFKFYKRFN